MATTNVIDDEVMVAGDHNFDHAADAVCEHFEGVLNNNGKNLFMVALDLGTKIEESGTRGQREVKRTLFDVYLEAFSGADRQVHNCAACRGFINKFGRLASLNHDGTIRPAMWNADLAPAHYRDAFAAMAKAVARGKVTAVFYHDAEMWGQQTTGGDYGFGSEKEWHHFYVKPSRDMVHRDPTKTAGQRRAASLQDFLTLQRALKEFDVASIKQAITLLETESLYRGEKTMGPAKFLLECHEVMAQAKGSKNVLWAQVAKAAPGFCSPRGSMIGTLLEDIQSGMAFSSVKRRFADKMDPLKYQRPVAPPSTGTIAQAEKLVASMGIERSLERRFARLDEVQTIWSPQPVKEETSRGGVFGHLKAKEDVPTRRPAMATPAVQITWEKFARTVLPHALKIEVYLDTKMAFAGVTTATHDDAPPILQWDTEEARNPFSWYFYHGGSAPSQWGLVARTWVEVTGIMLKPSMWNEKLAHHGRGAVLILNGAQDRSSDGAGLGLFPETMKAELHSVRKVIEAYSQKGVLSGQREASANGLGIGDRNGENRIKVTTSLGEAIYTVDRWD